MKVTVCFGTIRVVVPCGTGDLLVRDLINEATRRYKKAAGKDTDSWTVVHHLQSQSGGILDSDDRVSDVADDRELIVASFDDSGPDPGVPQGGGDGASGSSVGTGSPDIFRGPNDPKFSSDDVNDATTPHIEVTESSPANSSGLGLMVRRSSDPSLHQTSGNAEPNHSILNNSIKQYNDPTKRWSAAPVCRGDHDDSERLLSTLNTSGNQSYLSTAWENDGMEEILADSIPAHFTRNGRLSMQFLGDGNGYKWMDAAEKVSTSYNSKSLPRETKRKEPLGQAYESIREKDCKMLLVINENGGPLGLTAIPDCEKGGVLVQNVDPNSPAERGQLQRGDRILEINGTKLLGLSESSIQDHLRRCCAASELRLKVMKVSGQVQKLQKENAMIETEEKPTKVNNVSPSRKIPGATLSTVTSLQTANTRKIGRKIEISLCKGLKGLGFSVTTRDNPAGGHCPIYIKNILPYGAAIEDGRLRPGDRVLEVDGIPMTGKSQDEVVELLRATKPGANVKIIVSRQQDLSEISDDREIGTEQESAPIVNDKMTPPKPPPPVFPQKPSLKKSKVEQGKQLPEKGFAEVGNESAMPNESGQTFPWRNREILTLHIPVNDTEKAGLGVSVKGKTGSANSSNESNNSKTDGDLGIFVKSVLKGGAASRDGRLRMNDQLLMVNGISLLGQSNQEAMTTLRKSMVHMPGKYPKMITLQVARRISRPNSTIDNSELSNNSTSSASEQSGKTVIYVSPDKNDQRSKGSAHQNGEQSAVRSINTNRWSNPVLDRLTGGMQHSNQPRPPPLVTHGGLRNDSYYMATKDMWSPSIMNGNNSVLIEEDPEPLSPMFPMGSPINRTIENPNKPTSPSTPSACDATYSSQLSLETNPPIDPFNRDAIGRRSMSEKHHAALDAKETGTYQRNKKLREERERERRTRAGAASLGSMESLTNLNGNRSKTNGDLSREALDRVGDLGPSLGLKKSSSLESLQTVIQEMQMSDEPRGPNSLRTPRGRGREEYVRAEMERPEPRKHWLLEDNVNVNDGDGGFINRHGPFQSSLNEGKHKRAKKPGIFRGIGHMFRFGKHRKDGIMPTECAGDIVGPQVAQSTISATQKDTSSQKNSALHALSESRQRNGPPNYQPPPPVALGVPVAASSSGIHHSDLFNHRYSHYVNYEELQQQISPQTHTERLSESTLAQMRLQVMQQRVKVEEESRRHQHYHSTRSTRNDMSNHQPRPSSTYYEYETVQHISNGGFNHQNGHRKYNSAAMRGASPMKWHSPGNSIGGSGRSRGPFVTQVTIRDQPASHMNNNHLTQQPASKV